MLLYTHRSGRKKVDPILRTLKKTVLQPRILCLRRPSFLANGRQVRNVMILTKAVSLSNFRLLTRGYRVGSYNCGLYTVPLISELRLPLLRRHFVGFLLSIRDLPMHFAILSQLTVICVFYPSMTLRSLIMSASWIERSRMTSCSSCFASFFANISNGSFAVLSFLSTFPFSACSSELNHISRHTFMSSLCS